jgi:hypothetical protein
MVPGFNPIVPIQTSQWLECDDIFHFSQAYLLYFRLQAKMHYHYNNRTRSSIFLHAIQHPDYANTIMTLQSHVKLYCKRYDTGFLPPHLHLHGLAKSIHQNAQALLQDIVTPCVRCLDLGSYLIQGISNTSLLTPLINRLGQSEQNGNSLCDPDGGGGYSCGNCDQNHDGQKSYQRNPTACGQTKKSRAPRGHLARPDRKRGPFLPNVQCAVCKCVGHVVKHCDMLATAICIKRYIKHDLSSSVHDYIKMDWLARWKAHLVNPDGTPHQILCTYVEELDIMVANLDDAME